LAGTPRNMILSRIRLSNFRNHTATTVEFGNGINAFLGDNGQGKTNILEAVSYLSLTKSFYASGDAEVIGIGGEAFDIEGILVSDAGVQHQVRVTCTRMPQEKKFLVNGAPPEKLAAVIGRFPVVVLSPENGSITFGGPGERRKFMDLTLSQVSGAYLEDILEYRKALRQRNRILTDSRLRGTSTPGVIEPWTESLVAYGSRIAHRRALFAAEFRSHILGAYRSIMPDAESPDITYLCGFAAGVGEGVRGYAAGLAADLEARNSEERMRGVTLAGPHRDDLQLTINGMDVQRFASQGQHKTLLVAMKIAEYSYMRERHNETPLFLLDDVFSELDTGRVHRILALAGGLGQVMITTTEGTVFDRSVTWGNHNRRFIVERGTCRQEA
jgi:DNA replication and repair protein RecF